MADESRKRKDTWISDDLVATAIKEWWDEQGGPHKMAQSTDNSDAKNLADYLRSKGFIKDDI